MQTHAELWDLIEPLIKEEGLELYDLERAPGSKGKSGAIRVYLSRPASINGVEASANGVEDSEPSTDGKAVDAGVNVSDCARISKKISSVDRFEECIPDHTTLEVSSPGVNRKLRRNEHFASAVGEHVWLKGSTANDENDRVVRGVLEQFEDETVVIVEDQTEEKLSFDMRDIVSARIDFVFPS